MHIVLRGCLKANAKTLKFGGNLLTLRAIKHSAPPALSPRASGVGAET
jgi:hypothetical protein